MLTLSSSRNLFDPGSAITETKTPVDDIVNIAERSVTRSGLNSFVLIHELDFCRLVGSVNFGRFLLFSINTLIVRQSGVTSKLSLISDVPSISNTVTSCHASATPADSLL